MVILIFLFSIVFLLLSEQVADLAIYFSFLFIFVSSLNYYQDRNINYIQIWNLSFIYIVCSEMILKSEILQSSELYGLTAVKIILFANICVNMGYFINKMKQPKITEKKHAQPKGNIFNVFLLLALVYFFTFIQDSLTSFTGGRVAAMESRETDLQLLKTIIGGIGGALPVIATYFFRFLYKYKYKIKYIIILLLCLVPQILWGTRFALLFSIVAPAILFLIGRKFTLFDYVKIGIFFIVFITSVNFMKSYREILTRQHVVATNTASNTTVFEDIASYGSDEGVVYGTTHLLDYVNSNGYAYGQASAFIFYFWVPKAIWPEKPEQISYWLVRTYSAGNLSHVYSAAYGFWGELFFDFGYVSFVILFFGGFFMKRFDVLKDHYLSNFNYRSIFYLLLFPFLFIAVRSPQTSFISLFFIYFIYKLIGFISKKYFLKTQEK